MPILLALIPVIVPILVSIAEKQFDQPKQGDQKHAWVTGMVHEMLEVLGKHVTIPDWAATVEPGVEKLIDDAIIAAVAVIDP